MSNRLDKCLEALRLLAQSVELEATRLITAEVRIREFLRPVGTDRAARRAALEDLDNAVNREAGFRQREASLASDWGLHSPAVGNCSAMTVLCPTADVRVASRVRAPSGVTRPLSVWSASRFSQRVSWPVSGP